MRARLHERGSRLRFLLGAVSAVALVLGIAWTSGIPAQASVTTSGTTVNGVHFNAQGEVDCNGFSPVQKPLRLMNCTRYGLHVQRSRLRQQRQLDDHPRQEPGGSAHRRQPGP